MSGNCEKNFCGNCDSHNSYEYPTKVFCSTRHWHNLNPIVDTLWHCESYNRVSQECYCVQEAKKKAHELRKVKVNNLNNVLLKTCSPVV